ncbi:GDSL esterase/lipase [Forsythia ovata]|uniref:GDSL esterase/lipase n=1 Tax=Forsythia ovata TaxID=205694 RepID=A0ABD1PZ75_9LAMI
MDSCHFDIIYQLGDSLSDTDNLICESLVGSLYPFARLPYGETLFRNATALSSGLSLLKPYKEAEANLEHGVSFAIDGSTALPVETLAAMNIFSPVTSSSLSVQLDWMHSRFNISCQTQTECEQNIAKSLFMVGEIGENPFKT